MTSKHKQNNSAELLDLQGDVCGAQFEKHWLENKTICPFREDTAEAASLSFLQIPERISGYEESEGKGAAGAV